MLRALLPLLLTMVLGAEPPQTKAAVPPASNPASETPATRMQASIEKQRASVRKQASEWISIGDRQPNETFVIPWPKPALPASDIAYRTIEPFPCDPLPEEELQRMSADAAERQNVSPKLVRAMIEQESGGRPCAVSTAGAQGLMQLMPEVQREYAVADPFNPKASVEAGAKLLRNLLERYAGDVPKALAAYNAGPGAVDRSGGIPPIPETTNYVSSIVKKIQ